MHIEILLYTLYLVYYYAVPYILDSTLRYTYYSVNIFCRRALMVRSERVLSPNPSSVAKWQVTCLLWISAGVHFTYSLITLLY